MIKLLLVFIVTCISLSDACSCARIVKKDAWCISPFAGTIKVLSTGSSCGSMNICYKIAVVQQLRGTTISPTNLRTANNSAACGVTLTQGNTYFVTTNPINLNTLGLNLCQLTEDWTGLSSIQRFNKIQEYRRIRCFEIDPVKVDPGLTNS